MTDKQLIKLTNKVLSLNSDLVGKLGELASAASERLGYDVVADLCSGCEIEFRRVMDDGLPDSYSCIRIEEILNRKDSKNKIK